MGTVAAEITLLPSKAVATRMEAVGPHVRPPGDPGRDSTVVIQSPARGGDSPTPVEGA